MNGTTRAGVVSGDAVTFTDLPDVAALLADPGAATLSGPVVPLDQVELAPLVVRPGKIICVGVNYAVHQAEMGHERPAHPTLFAKYAEALIGADDPIVLPPESQAMDWEAELAVVVGTRIRRADRAAAAAAIGGYTILNDVTARDWQRRTSQWLQGKTFEGTTPIGPVLVTPDELGDPTAPPDLAISCEVDGVIRQTARTSQMMFDPFDIVSYVSTIVTLHPGDVIATGTPAGVGVGMDPPQFLRAGSTVTTTIEGIGSLTNRCQPAVL